MNERMPIVVQRGFFLDNLANEVVPRYFGSVLRLRIICQSWTSETVNHVNEREHLQQHAVAVGASAEANYYVNAHFRILRRTVERVNVTVGASAEANYLLRECVHNLCRILRGTVERVNERNACSEY